jgi:hypothetical protein
LTPEQRERMIQHLASKFGLDEQEVKDELDRVGCPVLDEGITVTVFNPQKWI